MITVPTVQRMQRIVNRLRLNEEQSTAVAAIFTQADPDVQKNQKAMRENQKRISALLETPSESVDAAMLREIADAQGKLHADSLVLRVNLLNQIRASLNEEQQALLTKRLQRQRGRDGKQRRDQMRKKRRERRQKQNAEARQQQTTTPEAEPKSE